MPNPNTEMNDRNDTIAPSHPKAGKLPVPNPLLNQESVLNRRPIHSSESNASMPQLDENESESIRAVVSEVEEFTRGWIGRIRRLIHRSSQLIERESLLAGAIARLDQQKSEWTKRTAAKEQGLRDQSKKLTEAWLEVETERRKAIQGARAAATANKPNGGPVLAAPVGSQPTSQPVVTPGNAGFRPPSSSPQQGVIQPPAAQQVSGAQQGTVTPTTSQNAAVPTQMPAAPPPVNPPVNLNVPVTGHPAPIQNAAVIGNVPAHSQMMPVPNAPITAGGSTSTGQELGNDEAFRQAEAATRQKIEEFKRMQRAIQSNRNT